MAISTVCYQAIRFKQTPESEWVAYFSANVMEIEQYSGVPQKTTFDDIESIGFQRTVKEERLSNLINFYSDNRNVIQNPLVCAIRDLANESNLKYNVEFTPKEEYTDNANIQVGEIAIEYDNIDGLTLLECLEELKIQLLYRLPTLDNEKLNQSLLAELKEQFFSDEEMEVSQSQDLESLDDEVAFENSHIKEFWQQILCRIDILTLDENRNEKTEILGFTKEALCSYLKPIVIVDGQHRLAGAIEHSKKLTEEKYFDEVKKLIASGTDADVATLDVQKTCSRSLPISLLMSSDPAEHVFQFVVVNQKATPINKALLGTIVSTTLSDDELEHVTGRLKDADIPLEDSKAISMVTRRIDSPFKDLVQTGIEKEAAGKLQWTVMKNLVAMFRDLKGGRYFSDEDKADHISYWMTGYLSESKLVSDNEDERTLETWKDNEIWYDVFKTFWTKVRDYFGNVTDPVEHNYWGNTKSNLFNKVYLHILTVDFFSFLNDKEYSLDSLDDLNEKIDKWLDGMSPSYFMSDWELGVKKDTPLLRKQWNRIWVSYRKMPKQRKRLPSKTEFKKI